jgi:hypothetical protein
MYNHLFIRNLILLRESVTLIELVLTSYLYYLTDTNQFFIYCISINGFFRNQMRGKCKYVHNVLPQLVRCHTLLNMSIPPNKMAFRI